MDLNSSPSARDARRGAPGAASSRGAGITEAAGFHQPAVQGARRVESTIEELGSLRGRHRDSKVVTPGPLRILSPIATVQVMVMENQ